MSSSLCLAPLLMLLPSLSHPQKQGEGTSGEMSSIKPCRTHNCSATANPADQTLAKFRYLAVIGYKCILPLHTSSAASTGWNKQGTKNRWGWSLLRNWTENSHCGSVLRAGKILRLGRHTRGSTCWRLFGALLPKKRQDSNKELTSNRDSKMKVKPRGLAGPGALSSERKGFQWNRECCYTTRPCWEVAQHFVCLTFFPQNNSRIYIPKSTVGNSSTQPVFKEQKTLVQDKTWDASLKGHWETWDRCCWIKISHICINLIMGR